MKEGASEDGKQREENNPAELRRQCRPRMADRALFHSHTFPGKGWAYCLLGGGVGGWLVATRAREVCSLAADGSSHTVSRVSVRSSDPSFFPFLGRISSLGCV